MQFHTAPPCDVKWFYGHGTEIDAAQGFRSDMSRLQPAVTRLAQHAEALGYDLNTGSMIEVRSDTVGRFYSKPNGEGQVFLTLGR